MVKMMAWRRYRLHMVREQHGVRRSPYLLRPAAIYAGVPLISGARLALRDVNDRGGGQKRVYVLIPSI